MNYIDKQPNTSLKIILAFIIVSFLIAPIAVTATENSDTLTIDDRVYLGQETGQQQLNPEANLGFLFAVFAITWLGFFAYVFLIARRQKELNREIAILKNLIEENRTLTGKDYCPFLALELLIIVQI